jgi:NhaA family Na+:H+ antiporter
MRVQAVGGLILLAAAIFALAWANSPWANIYHDVLETHIALTLGRFRIGMTLHHLVNDGFMTIFFFLVGLEIKRELLVGHLSNPKAVALPAAAALGGMVIPAAIYLAFHFGEPTAQGWGIPMATDIAFVVGLLSLLGSRVPHSLKVLVLALAIVDDLGAILVIAIFYATDLLFLPLGLAMGGLVLVFFMLRAGVRSTPAYLILGILVWLGFLESGVHPTLAGVLLAFLVPISARTSPERLFEQIGSWAEERNGSVPDRAGTHTQRDAIRNLGRLQHDAISPLQRLETALNPWVAYLIMPVFALANAGVSLSSESLGSGAAVWVSVAVAVSLLVGKPLGIFLFSLLAVKTGAARLPVEIRWRGLFGAGVLAGIGFTVSLFIASLAFVDQEMLDAAKIGILAGSVLAGVMGLLLLWMSFRRVDHQRS